jgi:alpha-1,2-mannosyltransferase
MRTVGSYRTAAGGGRRSEAWLAWLAPLAFIASAAALAAMIDGRLQVPLVHPLTHFHYFDLRVYRRAAGVLSAGRALYKAKLGRGLGFTYPPLAAAMFLVLRLLTVHQDETAVTALNVVLVAAGAHLALRLRRPDDDLRLTQLGVARLQRRRWVIAWLAAAAALWAEPVSTAIGYGQIDVLIAVLVVLDLAYSSAAPRRADGTRAERPFAGVAIGAAAAIMLTPLVFIPYLALGGRLRMALRAALTFALSVIVELIVFPRDAWTYWIDGKFMDVTRVTGRLHLAGSGAADQSLRGALLRLFPHLAGQHQLWLASCLVVGTVGLLLAARAARRGDDAWGFLLTALSGLLISPVSWTHQWTLAVVAAIGLIGSRSWSPAGALRGALAAACGLAAGRIWLAVALGSGRRLDPGQLLLGNLYVIAAAATLTVAAVIEYRHSARERPGAGAQTARRRTLPEPAAQAALSALSAGGVELPARTGDTLVPG